MHSLPTFIMSDAVIAMQMGGVAFVQSGDVH